MDVLNSDNPCLRLPIKLRPLWDISFQSLDYSPFCQAKRAIWIGGDIQNLLPRMLRKKTTFKAILREKTFLKVQAVKPVITIKANRKKQLMTSAENVN